MKCEIILNRKPNGEIDPDVVKAVKAPNGNRSLLFDHLKVDDPKGKQAFIAYHKLTSDEFKNAVKDYDYNVDSNNEPQLNTKRKLELKKGNDRIIIDPFDFKINSMLSQESKPVDSPNKIYEKLLDLQGIDEELVSDINLLVSGLDYLKMEYGFEYIFDDTTDRLMTYNNNQFIINPNIPISPRILEMHYQALDFAYSLKNYNTNDRNKIIKNLKAENKFEFLEALVSDLDQNEDFKLGLIASQLGLLDPEELNYDDEQNRNSVKLLNKNDYQSMLHIFGSYMTLRSSILTKAPLKNVLKNFNDLYTVAESKNIITSDDKFKIFTAISLDYDDGNDFAVLNLLNDLESKIINSEIDSGVAMTRKFLENFYKYMGSINIPMDILFSYNFKNISQIDVEQSFRVNELLDIFFNKNKSLKNKVDEFLTNFSPDENTFNNNLESIRKELSKKINNQDFSNDFVKAIANNKYNDEKLFKLVALMEYSLNDSNYQKLYTNNELDLSDENLNNFVKDNILNEQLQYVSSDSFSDNIFHKNPRLKYSDASFVESRARSSNNKYTLKNLEEALGKPVKLTHKASLNSKNMSSFFSLNKKMHLSAALTKESDPAGWDGDIIFTFNKNIPIVNIQEGNSYSGFGDAYNLKKNTGDVEYYLKNAKSNNIDGYDEAIIEFDFEYVDSITVDLSKNFDQNFSVNNLISYAKSKNPNIKVNFINYEAANNVSNLNALYRMEPREEITNLVKSLFEKMNYTVSVNESSALEYFDFINKIVSLPDTSQQSIMSLPSAYGKMVAILELNNLKRTVFPTMRLTHEYKIKLDKYISDSTYLDSNGYPDLEKIDIQIFSEYFATMFIDKNIEKSLFDKIINFIKDVINKINSSLSNDARKQISELVDKYTYLQGFDSSIEAMSAQGKQLITYESTLEQQNRIDDGYAYDIMKNMNKLGLAINGSLALRKSGTVFRKSIDNLHDIDMSITNPDQWGLYDTPVTTKEEFTNTSLYHQMKLQYPNLELTGLISSYDTVNESPSTTIQGFIYKTEDAKKKYLKAQKQFGSITATVEHLQKTDPEVLENVYLLDVFWNTRPSLKLTTTDQNTEITLSNPESIFEAKISMGRQKDIMDYAAFKPYQFIETTGRFTFISPVSRMVNDQNFNPTKEQFQQVLKQEFGKDLESKVDHSIKPIQETTSVFEFNKPVEKPTPVEEVVTEESEPEKQLIKANRELLQMLSDKTGVKYEIVNDPTDKSWVGKYENGKVYINEANLTSDEVLWHEFLHPFVDTLRSQNPALFRALQEKVQEVLMNMQYNKNDDFDPALKNRLERLRRDKEYVVDGKLVKSDDDHASKEAITELLGYLANEEYSSRKYKSQDTGLFERFVNWFKALLEKVVGAKQVNLKLIKNTTTFSELVDIITYDNNKFSLQTNISQRTQYRKNDEIDLKGMTATGNYSDNQLQFVEKFNEKVQLVGEPVEVTASELPVKIQRELDLNPTDKITRYERLGDPNKKVWDYRTTDKQKILFNKRAGKNASKVNTSSFSTVQAKAGTAMHAYNELILNTLVNQFNWRPEHSSMSQAEFVENAIKFFETSDTYYNAVKEISSGESIFAHKEVNRKQWNTDAEPDYDLLNDVSSWNPDMMFSLKDSEVRKYIANGNIDADLIINGINNYRKLVRSMLKIYYDSNVQQAKIDPSKKPLFLFEKILVNEVTNTAGSPDVVVVYSDKTFDILDHKFIGLNFTMKKFDNPTAVQKEQIKRIRRMQGLPAEYRTKKDGTKPDDNWIWTIDDSPENQRKLAAKQESYESQITDYAKTLIKQYGLKSMRKGRVIPFSTRFTKENVNGKYIMTDDSRIQFLMTDDDNAIAAGLLNQIPVKRESSGDPKLDIMIQKLLDISDNMRTEMNRKGLWNDPEYKARYDNISRNIRDLQVTSNFGALSNYIINLNKMVSEGLKITDNTSDRFLDFKAINGILREIELYSEIIQYVVPDPEDTELLEKNDANRIKLEMGSSLTSLINNKKKLEAVMLERLINFVESEGMMSRDEFMQYMNQEDIGFLKNWFGHLRTFNHPIFVTFSKIMDNINYEKQQYQKDLYDRIEKSTKALQDWGKRNGKSGTAVYQDIIKFEKDDYVLIKKYSKELFELRNQMSKENNVENVEWFKNTFHRSTEKDATGLSDEDRFQEKKKKVEQYFKKITTSDEELNKKMEAWLNDNDIHHNNGNNNAWFNRFVYKMMSPKNPEKYYSEDYKNLLKPNNKELLDFYNLFTNEIAQIADESGIYMNQWFIPNIKKDMIDMMSQDGMMATMGPQRMKQTGQAILESLSTTKEDIVRVSSLTGMEHKEIPFFYTDKLADPQTKSLDLGKSLYMFATMAKNYSELKQSEDMILSLRSLIATSTFVRKNAQGTETIPNTNVPMAHRIEGSNTLKAFDSFVNYYLYDEKLQKDMLSETLKERGVKIALAIQAQSTKANMSFNILSAGAGYLGARAQMRAIAAKNKYYTHKQLNEASKLLVQNSAKTKYAMELFEDWGITLDDERHMFGNELSMSKLRKAFKEDWAYAFHKTADKSIEKTAFLAMLMNYGIDPKTKEVVRLATLASRHPKEKHKSLWDSIEESGSEADSSFSIKAPDGTNMDKKSIISFRVKAKEISGRIKGDMSEDNVAAYKSTILGRLLMNYRGWIPATLNERFKHADYNHTMDEFEVGKFTAALNFVQGNILKNTAKLTGMFIPFIGNRFIDDIKNSPEMKKKYEEFLNRNPMSADPNSKTYVSYDNFISTYQNEIKSLMTELRIFYAFLTLGLLGAAAWPEDERTDNPAIASALAVINRAQLEIGFYLPFEPTLSGWGEFTQILTKAPFPLINSVNKVANLFKNTTSESWDLFSGTDWDKTSIPELGEGAWSLNFDQRKDNTPIGNYTAELLGLGNVRDFFGFMGTTDKKDTLWDYVPSRQ